MLYTCVCCTVGCDFVMRPANVVQMAPKASKTTRGAKKAKKAGKEGKTQAEDTDIMSTFCCLMSTLFYTCRHYVGFLTRSTIRPTPASASLEKKEDATPPWRTAMWWTTSRIYPTSPVSCPNLSFVPLLLCGWLCGLT